MLSTAESLAATSELALVRAAKMGDNRAFEELVRSYEHRIFKVANYIAQNREDAEDIVQDSFLKAYQNLAQFREESKFYTWLVRIVVNDALMKLRRRRMMKMISIDASPEHEENSLPIEIVDSRANPEQRLRQQQLQKHLTKAVRELRPLFRVVFVLRDVQGLSILETAEALNISVPLVKTRLLRARLKLRRRLDVHFGNPVAAPRESFAPGLALRQAARL